MFVLALNFRLAWSSYFGSFEIVTLETLLFLIFNVKLQKQAYVPSVRWNSQIFACYELLVG